MGRVYGDRFQDPRSAAAVLGDFCFLAGEPNPGLLPAGGAKQPYRILIPQTDRWAALIERVYGAGVRAITRYATRKDPAAFDRAVLERAVRALGPEYRMRTIDANTFALCRTQAWSRDLVAQFDGFCAFQELGLGVAVFYHGTLAAGASTYARWRGGIEIEIDTREEFRRRGLARACGAQLILHCLDRGLYPSWDAHSRASLALAETLGYRLDHSYLAYEVGTPF